MQLTQASKQWASRPDDERFTSLTDLKNLVDSVRKNSKSAVVSNRAIEFQPVGDSITEIQIASRDGSVVSPTHWAFSQLATKAKAPADFLRTLPSPMTADILNLKLRIDSPIEDMGILVGYNDNGVAETMRAATGPNYGRVWNADIAGSLVNMFGDGATGDWKVPGEFGKDAAITKDNTTLYASDRDMFCFLADEKNRIEIPNRRDGKSGSLARGFFVWNSEVGSQSFGMAAFLFDYACSNRIVWGATEYRETRFRHTSSAPDKWIESVVPMLSAYAESSAAPYEATLIAAQNKKLDDVTAFLANRFSKRQAMQIQAAHLQDEGHPIETVWDAVTGVTAFARGVKFQDERVLIERTAGKILDLVAA